MPLDPNAVRIANEQLWEAYPELKRRQLGLKPEDAKYRRAWWKYYNEAAAKKPPAPKKKPSAKPSPAPPAGPPGTVAPTKKKVTDCADVKNHVKEGDIVLRSTPGANSDLIRQAGRCDYSHAGIIARNAAGDLVVVDAYPGRAVGAVKEESIDDFFCKHGTSKGLVARPKDPKLGEKAAQWAMAQTKDPAYQFDIFNPWNRDPKQLYCSDFVYQSYQNAGVELVDKKMDFLSSANKENTLEAMRIYMKKEGDSEEKMTAKWASDETLESELKSRAGGSEYITPCQVAVNGNMDTAVDFEPPSAKGSGGDPKK